MTRELTQEEKATNDATWRHINRVQDLLSHVITLLLHRLTVHDQSKLELPEVEMFMKYTPKLREMEFSRDPDSEYQKCLEEMKKTALKHHYEDNSHHPEHYKNGINGMDLLDFIEMLCDWKAAGERHADGGDIFRSIEQNLGYFGIEDQLGQILKNTARNMFFPKAP